MAPVRPSLWGSSPAPAIALVLAAACALGGLTGCSSSADADASAKTPSSTTSPSTASSGATLPQPGPTASGKATSKGTPSASGSGGASASPTGSPAPALPNPAPARIDKVLRNGRAPVPTVTAAPQAFTAPVTYSDGIVLSVGKATKAIEEGHGAGTFAGRELLVVDLEFTNGTTKPVLLDQVVLTALYGKSRQLAPAVYPPNVAVKDFGGTVAPRATAKARYTFAIPSRELGAVTLVIDFDGAHASTVFTGKVTAS